MTKQLEDLYLVHISIHGLIRGGESGTRPRCRHRRPVQVRARAGQGPGPAPAGRPGGPADPPGRSIRRSSADYAQPVEELGDGAAIRASRPGRAATCARRCCGATSTSSSTRPWPCSARPGACRTSSTPTTRDAGYVGRQLSTLLGCPFIFTGHSLGRTKRSACSRAAPTPERIEQRYNLSDPHRSRGTEPAMPPRWSAPAPARRSTSSIPSTSSTRPTACGSSRRASMCRASRRPDELEIPRGGDGKDRALPRPSGAPAGAGDRARRREEEPRHPGPRLRRKQDPAGRGQPAHRRRQPRRRSASSIPGARKVWTELLQLIDDYDLYGIGRDSQAPRARRGPGTSTATRRQPAGCSSTRR